MGIVKSSDANEKLIQITTRFTEDEYRAIEDVAKINNRAMSEIIRLCVENRLPKYLDTIFFYDNEMGEAVRSELVKLNTILEGIKYELLRQGINYNQELKLRNIEAKYKGRNSPVQFKQKEKEIQSVMADTNTFNKEEVLELLQRFEEATKKAGEAICHILE